MISILLLNAAFCANALILNCDFAATKTSQARPSSRPPIAYRSPFRYVIIADTASRLVPNPNEYSRTVEVLLDHKAFTQANLKCLFELISKRFPVPRALIIAVYTSLEDAKTPEENDIQVFDGPDDPSADNYQRAHYYRDGSGNEWFIYNPRPPSREIRKVIIKGRAP